MEQSVAMSLNVHNRAVFLPAFVATQVNIGNMRKYILRRLSEKNHVDITILT